jgi:transitional endoplasmic reticulum ATPase
MPLSLYTLLAVLLLPLGYFFYHRRYWYNSKLIQMWDFVLFMVAVVILCFVVLAFSKNPEVRSDKNLQLLHLLHIIPAIYIFLLVGLISKSGQGGVSRGGGGKSGDAKGGEVDFKPIRLKNTVEALTWDDVILDEKTKTELKMLVELLKDPKASLKYGIETPKGVLLSGPPGTGKTTIAKVIANTAGLSFFILKLDDVVSKWVGESEKNLSRLFKAAERYAPALIFVDEVDSIGAQRSGEHAWSDNLLNHMLQLIDGVVKSRGVHVVAATNRPDLVDGALKRAGRLNRTIEIPLPTREARIQLFALNLSKLNLADEIDLDVLAEVTEGKSGADIKAICNQAGLNAFRRESGGSENTREYQVRAVDIQEALQDFLVTLTPTTKRNPNDPHSNFIPTPVGEGVEEVGWDDLIINQEVKSELITLMELLKDPKSAAAYGVQVPKGVLLYGPPGTGKTTIARVIANSAGLTFFALRMDEVVSKWVGESEKNLSRLFDTAQKHSPSLIFVDEVDSLGAERGRSTNSSSDNLLNHLLQLIDGIIKSEGINIIAATNRPDLVDSALKRSGRLNRLIEIPLPDYKSRCLLFKQFLAKLRLEEELNLDILAKLTDGKSGADIKAICNQAGLNAFRRESAAGRRSFTVSHDDVRDALAVFLNQ